jgi:uncharacterized protein YjiS (DUF1127 family)
VMAGVLVNRSRNPILQCISDPFGTSYRWRFVRLADAIARQEREQVMSTITMPEASSAALEGTPRAGVLRRIFHAIVASRSRRAERDIAQYLGAKSDQNLSDLGFSPTEIGLIRAGLPVGEVLARRTSGWR